MQTSRRSAIREVLQAHPDGLSVHQINVLLGRKENDGATHRAVSVMPDVYIDRWERGVGSQAKYRAVYCAVEIPDNCPHPTRTKRKEVNEK